jgi:NADH-quinone oxidoreductase subunit N
MDLNTAFPLIPLTQSELFSLLPLFTISFGALFSLLVATHKTKGRGLAFIVSFSFLLFAMFQGMFPIFNTDVTLLGGTLTFSPFTKTMNVMIMLFALIGVVLTYGQDHKEGILAEIYSLIMFSTAGMMMMVSTTHLLFMFIALEIMSLAVYVMVAMRRNSRFSAEAGLKYFVLGGLASAFFLYGTSLVFGSLGSFELLTLSNVLRDTPQPSFIFFIGLGLITAAMLFKVGAFPFHGWVPDVYQGAATNVTAFMGAAVKFTAFLAFAKIAENLIFIEAVPNLVWFQNFIWIVAAASMIYGNFVAIAQNEIKRMLAFSTIAHSGYLLLGLYTMSIGEESVQSLVLYLFFYALANLGAFAVIAMFEEKNQKDLHIDQLAGLGMKHPILGILLTIFLFSMAGIPLTSGFIGKYGLFSSAVSAGEIPLVIIAVLTSVVSVYYYLRVIIYLFMKESTIDTARYQKLKGAALAAFLSAAATLQFGLFPRAIINFIKMIGN